MGALAHLGQGCFADHVAEQSPYSEEDERIAYALVEEALAPFRKLTSGKRLEEVREQMVDELLATENGRAKIRTAKAYMMAKSEDLPLGPEAEAASEKKKQGSGG